jgi:hypothetical protein
MAKIVVSNSGQMSNGKKYGIGFDNLPPEQRKKLGKHFTLEQRSAAGKIGGSRGAFVKKVTCQYCGRSGSGGFVRWHLENCREKK